MGGHSGHCDGSKWVPIKNICLYCLSHVPSKQFLSKDLRFFDYNSKD